MEDVGLEALDLLTVEEVAARLRVSVMTVRRLYYAEDKEPGTGIEAVRVGTRRLIAPEAVIAYKERLRREAGQSSAARAAAPDAA
jgi:excisionase family DNA binding protein